MKKRIIYVALFCGLGLTVWRLWPRDAQYYYNRGVDRLQADADDEDSGSDLDGALADFSRAIRLNPNFAAAYERRAFVKSMMADESGARSDYNQALGFEPYNPVVYASRSGFEESRDHLDAAIADLDRAIELNPKEYVYYDRRAYLKYKQDDISGWVADRERASEVFARDETLLKEMQLHERGIGPDRPANLVRGLLRNYNRAIGQNTN